MKLHGALKGLICEIASLDSIVDAIKNRKIIIINYNPHQPGILHANKLSEVELGFSLTWPYEY